MRVYLLAGSFPVAKAVQKCWCGLEKRALYLGISHCILFKSCCIHFHLTWQIYNFSSISNLHLERKSVNPFLGQRTSFELLYQKLELPESNRINFPHPHYPLECKKRDRNKDETRFWRILPGKPHIGYQIHIFPNKVDTSSEKSVFGPVCSSRALLQ